MMNNVIKNERGSTLIEVISVIIVTVVMISSAVYGIVAFYKSYRRISDFVALQQEAMEMMVTIQNGIDTDEFVDANFMGVANAKSLKIINYSSYLNKGDGVEVTPPKSSPIETNDKMVFILENGVVNAYWTYRGRSVGPHRVFPSEQYEHLIDIVEFSVSDPTRGIGFAMGQNLGIIQVNLEARVRLNDNPRPSQQEFRSIHFRTLMARKV